MDSVVGYIYLANIFLSELEWSAFYYRIISNTFRLYLTISSPQKSSV